MQVSIETTTGLERRLTISVPADNVDSKVDERVAETATKARLKGFRPGKVPKSVVKTQFGAGIRQEVVGEVIGQAFYEAVAQEKLEPAGQPTIDFKTDKAGKDLEFTATFEVVPEVEVADLSALNVEKPACEIGDEDVDRMIEMLRDQQGSWEAVEREAQDKDQVKIDYKGTKDGEAFDGGTAEDQNLVLGSGRMIPGFEDGIVGLKAGEEKTLALTFPEDYHAEELKGAAVEFAVTVKSVEERKVAELNEEFFAKFNVDGGVDEFRAEITKNMQRELKQATGRLVKQAVMDQLVENNEIQIPAAMITSEIDQLREQMVQQFSQGGQGGFDKSMLPDDLFQDRAERRVKLGLLVRSIVSGQEISVDADSVKAEIDEIASTYEQPEEVVNYYYGNQQLLQSVEGKVLEDQVVEYVLSQASVSDAEMAYEDIVQKAQAAAQQQ
jgi:trigger factor